jgi:hypothetical protein
MKDNENSTRCNGKLTPYEWQRAISASNLDPVTRGVLFALSLYINKSTGCAFPSLRTLSSASGYSLDAVRRHIKIALNSGWIEINNAELEGQGWRRNAYIPMIPEGTPRRLETKHKHKRVLPVSIPSQEGVLSISTPLTQEGVLPQPQGVLPQPQGVLPQPLNTAPENAPEPAPTVAFSDSPAVPNNILTRKEQEREGEIPPSTPPDSLSVCSNSPQEGETLKVGGDIEAATAQSAGGDSGLGCQNQAVKIATKASGKPATGRERQYQGGVAQPLPIPWALSDDETKASMKRTGWSEAKVKREALKFRNRHVSKRTLSYSWAAEWENWELQGLDYEAKHGKVERTAPRPPPFVAEPKAAIDPSKPRLSHMPMVRAAIARATAQP